MSRRPGKTSRSRKALHGLQLFDCTTVEGRGEDYPWAANNGDKRAIRLALGLDAATDRPSVVLLDASQTTSDNSVLPAIVAELQPGTTVVVDAGFTPGWTILPPLAAIQRATLSPGWLPFIRSKP